MNNQQAIENVNDLNLIFEILGFDEENRKNHTTRIIAIIFASVSEKLDQTIKGNNKIDLPEMNSLEDFYNYYGQYVDKNTINKIIKEESLKSFSDYFKTIADQIAK